ncbi:MAG TPA: hypothetical protein VFP84_07855 [Kofleriaceae bacterium]|nr:hypothetical protein [Kofleriaceae bacterium]
MASPEQDIATVKHAVAREVKVGDDDVKVQVLDDVDVPGITVFLATVHRDKAGRFLARSGIVEGGKLFSEAAAMARVARAWGYGAKRTVPPETVAEVFGALHVATASATAMYDPDTIEAFKKTAKPRRAAALAMPRETTVNGLPAVTYCVSSSAPSVLFSTVTAVIHPDFRVELHAQKVIDE